MVIDDIHLPSKKNNQKRAESFADPVDRIASFVVDTFIVLMPILLLLNAPYKKYFYSGVLLDENLTIMYSIFFSVLTSFLFITSYRALMAWYFGGTVGKLFLGLRIVDIWYSKKPKLSNCFLRELTWWFGWLTLGFSYLSVSSNSKRRMYHDRVSDTLVISINKRGVTYPGIYEKSVVRGVFVGFLIFITSIFGLMTIKMQKKLAVSSHITDLLEERGQLCESVGNEIKNLSNTGDPLIRLETAMAMYAADNIGEPCLESEVNFLFRQNHNYPLMYLAKSFLYRDRPKLSGSYLDRVCHLSLESKECYMSRIVSLLDREDWNQVDKMFFEVDKSWPLYIQIWAIKNAVEKGNFSQAKKNIDELPELPSLKNFKTALKTKTYVGFSDLSKYDQIADLAFSSLKPKETKKLAAWLCYQQVSTDCKYFGSLSCQMMLVSKGQNNNSDIQHDITQARLQMCKGNFSSQMASHKDRDFSKLSYALATMRLDKKKAEDILWSIYKGREYKTLIKEDAARHLLSLISDEDGFLKFVIFWKTQSRLYSWNRTGHILFNRLVDLGFVNLAKEVGDEIYNNFESIPEFKKSFIMTLFQSGERKKAWNLLKNGQAGQAKVERVPASVYDKFDFVYDELKREFLGQ